MGNMQNSVYGLPLPVIACSTNSAKERKEGIGLGGVVWQSCGYGTNWQGSSSDYILHVSHCVKYYILSKSKSLVGTLFYQSARVILMPCILHLKKKIVPF